MRTLRLGLALGAGGTKGGAHVGVMQVLDEAGIKIDAVAGTSIGSLYGGAFAVGRTPQEMADGIRSCPHSDVIAFFRHRLKIRHNNRLARKFYDALAGFQIEQMPVPFAATASDIADRCAVIIDRGPLIDAIEASIAIPFIARPVAHQGRYLLDGGFWEAAPVSAALHLGADVVVAVELGNPYTLPTALHAPASWLASRFEKIRLSRTLAGMPFTMHAITRPLTPGRAAGVVIRPNVSRMSGNSPFGMRAALDAGLAAAEEALPAIRALVVGEPLPAIVEEHAPAQRMLLDPGM